MDRLWPTDQVDDAELERLYDYPDGLTRPWVKANFVSSADGAVSVNGRSHGLSDRNDRKIFKLGRTLADVILVGAGTALVERYRAVKPNELPAETRQRLGLAPVPPTAVVTGRCSIEPASPLITGAVVPTIVLTTSSAPARRREALAAAGAEVVVAGEQTVDAKLALDELDRRGLRRIDCEGGPHLFGSLIVADVVDELCLSVAPLLTAGDAGRIATSRLPATARLALASILRADDMLLLRYLRSPSSASRATG